MDHLPTTIWDLLAQGQADAPAISAPGRESLTYAGLRDQVSQTVTFLNQLGFHPGDRIAMVLPNGPEMATSFISIAAGMTTAPLNPAYQRAEFEFYLQDLKANALLVAGDSISEAIAVGRSLNIPILRMLVDPNEPAGRFKIEVEDTAAVRQGSVKDSGFAAEEDQALLLHTSGTTSRPKLVPLTQKNLCASARNICETLKLRPEDICLNIMPLFHIHGLIAAVLSSLRAGASVFCTPGFNALQFFSWFSAAKPTWYTAVPTMHQAILERASRNPEALAASRLRFIRSSSASLPVPVFHELESLFDAPVIEAYGMTEASHQMTSNLLPSGKRKPGTVGVGIGLEVAILGEDRKFKPAGESGEIVIRGENVTHGYEGNPKANAESFFDGWFRTGDLGSKDEDGYLTINGRIKEIINRGGEKISPREVDDVLMDHPAVQQVVTFGMPHPKLGEEVAAAVVLRASMQVSEQELRTFARDRLAPFKVPRKILFLAEIPKGATGKLQRIGLAEKLGLT